MSRIVRSEMKLVRTAPSPQNALDIFKDEWIVRFPPDLGLRAGSFPGDAFNDPCLLEAEKHFGGFEGRRVLELGPFEGHHSSLISRRGARSVVAVEANVHAFLKCLITKEVMGLANVSFLLGDLVEFMRGATERFDVIVASGILYHLTSPVEALRLMAALSDKLFIRTHYFDEDLIEKSCWAGRFTEIPADRTDDGVAHFELEYRDADSPFYNGGIGDRTSWITRGDILVTLERLGFRIELTSDEPEHPSGPAISFAAVR